MDTLILPAFRFELSLMEAPEIVAGSQRALEDSNEAPPAGGRMLGNGAFQECSGLEIEMDVQEYAEGGRNNGVIRRAGRAKYQPLVLKRGMFYETERAEEDAATAGQPDPSAGNKANADLWRWMQDVVNGVRPIKRCDGMIYVMSADKQVRATWVFERGLPAKIRGPELNGKTGEIAIEEFHIVHEGLRLLMPDGAAA